MHLHAIQQSCARDPLLRPDYPFRHITDHADEHHPPPSARAAGERERRNTLWVTLKYHAIHVHLARIGHLPERTIHVACPILPGLLNTRAHPPCLEVCSIDREAGKTARA